MKAITSIKVTVLEHSNLSCRHNHKAVEMIDFNTVLLNRRSVIGMLVESALVMTE